MKFFTASIFVLLIGGSFGSPAPDHGNLGDILKPDGLLGGVLSSVDVLLGDVVGTVHNTVENLSDVVRNVLNQLPQVTDEVLSTVGNLLKETGKGLAVTVNNVVNGILTFTAVGSEGVLEISINCDSLEVSVRGDAFGKLCEDGSITDLEGVVIGLLNAADAVLLFAGETVDRLLDGVGNIVGSVGGLLDGVLFEAGNVLEGVVEAVQNAVANLSDSLRDTLRELPAVTEEVVCSVEDLIRQTGKALVFTTQEILDNVLTCTAEVSGEDLIVVSINMDTLEVSVDGEVCGELCEDGSITDLEGVLMGLFDNVTGVLVIAGDEVDSLLDKADGVVGGLLNGLFNGPLFG